LQQQQQQEASAKQQHVAFDDGDEELDGGDDVDDSTQTSLQAGAGIDGSPGLHDAPGATSKHGGLPSSNSSSGFPSDASRPSKPASVVSGGTLSAQSDAALHAHAALSHADNAHVVAEVVGAGVDVASDASATGAGNNAGGSSASSGSEAAEAAVAAEHGDDKADADEDGDEAMGSETGATTSQRRHSEHRNNHRQAVSWVNKRMIKISNADKQLGFQIPRKWVEGKKELGSPAVLRNQLTKYLAKALGVNEEQLPLVCATRVMLPNSKYTLTFLYTFRSTNQCDKVRELLSKKEILFEAVRPEMSTVECSGFSVQTSVEEMNEWIADGKIWKQCDLAGIHCTDISRDSRGIARFMLPTMYINNLQNWRIGTPDGKGVKLGPWKLLVPKQKELRSYCTHCHSIGHSNYGSKCKKEHKCGICSAVATCADGCVNPSTRCCPHPWHSDDDNTNHTIYSCEYFKRERKPITFKQYSKDAVEPLPMPKASVKRKPAEQKQASAVKPSAANSQAAWPKPQGAWAKPAGAVGSSSSKSSNARMDPYVQMELQKRDHEIAMLQKQVQAIMAQNQAVVKQLNDANLSCSKASQAAVEARQEAKQLSIALLEMRTEMNAKLQGLDSHLLALAGRLPASVPPAAAAPMAPAAPPVQQLHPPVAPSASQEQKDVPLSSLGGLGVKPKGSPESKMASSEKAKPKKGKKNNGSEAQNQPARSDFEKSSSSNKQTKKGQLVNTTEAKDAGNSLLLSSYLSVLSSHLVPKGYPKNKKEALGGVVMASRARLHNKVEQLDKTVDAAFLDTFFEAELEVLRPSIPRERQQSVKASELTRLLFDHAGNFSLN